MALNQQAGQNNIAGGSNFTKYEKRALQRQERQEVLERQEKKRRLKKIGLGVLILAVLGLAVGTLIWYLNLRGEDVSVSFADQGREHIQSGASHPAYNSNPPTSGWHYAKPAPVGFYEEELPDETLIHNLEHGEVWIAYQPSVSGEVKEELKKFAGGLIVVTPRSANDTDVALAAWTRLDKFNLENGRLDKKRVDGFIKRYKNRGPEKLPPGAHAQK